MSSSATQRDLTTLPTEILQDRLQHLDAIVAAVARPTDVTSAVLESDSRDSARAAIARLLDVQPEAARAVLDLRWEELNEASRRAVNEERSDVASELQRRATPG